MSKIEEKRHSLAHLLAAAVLELYPDAKNTIGPAIDNGFYYDFDFPSPISDTDLKEIEKKMKKLSNGWRGFEKKDVTEKEVKEFFKDNPYKLELIDEIVSKGEPLTLYTSGQFTDLCRGGHVEEMKEIEPDSWKLSHLAGAYWRGDEKNKMLTRIYGLAFETGEELEAYEKQQEEAKKRDHRKLGAELNLFSVDERLGQGLILWHPKGGIIRKEIEDYERELVLKHGYDLVYTPHIASEKLFMESGHLENYIDSMYGPMEIEGEKYRLKPMNCPGHICIYQSRVHSYRDLPLRFAEFGTVYRYELSGTLQGLLRVRGFTQDDAHIFCTPEQVENEVKELLSLVDEMLKTFRYPYSIELSTRPEKAIGSSEVWEKAENLLKEVLEKEGKEYTIDAGGGAFYGPKLDFKLIDSLGRKWQGPTVQLDFNLPERFKMEYIGSDGRAHRPVMLHRVLVGSMERFFGGLIEHYAGAFPLWLAPVQARILPIGEAHFEYATSVLDKMKAAGIRAELDVSDETLGKKIRNFKTEKIPYALVIGDKELNDKKVTVESRDRGNEGAQGIEELIEKLKTEIKERK
ncbi:MAG: threonine--tRNA ligase [Candidatus Zambryskibacteria bacterium RIFCSPLOWO2_02_FULL_51_21]|uniref:Threonine--tRNA ligase n=1 Tax=Candidatus Zambryskibacteria bacterium RIFCSPHIGHO2_02_FULL_43_37 TaxID=1802749 RepID=A0A1G2THZ7_9BACT|nr:MAG: threonine--tRNA ligase [Candidatus Zambryskibacteria bacterium RIFCSPHIGHO2_01_FULL_52_18]OHA96688.1 MAG: threonine--tRNA ligase [Candidatus Zambryskibacteria bacterium RIFCSPHIGHO2_02_FULL_43_37]OHB06711.1 MAG: threonine--tRNA ligase [Candidatus Zambryskibacteria bacterium RIFCSPLOWO2_01_FULL_52_12]OHB11044.1 MAG: threonine--tRNA ligase [Candidatus Zambryskibacteria bacterium RIFCSPLOWO2_02_FULL_51_21]